MNSKKIKIITISILLTILIIVITLIFYKKSTINNKRENYLNITDYFWKSTKVEIYKNDKLDLETPSNLITLNFTDNSVEMCLNDEEKKCDTFNFTHNSNKYELNLTNFLKLNNAYFEFSESEELLLMGDIENNLKIKYYFDKDTES